GRGGVGVRPLDAGRDRLRVDGYAHERRHRHRNPLTAAEASMALSNDNPAGTRFFSNLRFRYKILALPLVATLGFLVILAANGIMASRQEQRLLLVESVYYPSVQLSAGLETTMIDIQHGLQDAVSASNAQQLDDVDK